MRKMRKMRKMFVFSVLCLFLLSQDSLFSKDYSHNNSGYNTGSTNSVDVSSILERLEVLESSPATVTSNSIKNAGGVLSDGSVKFNGIVDFGVIQ